MTRKQREIERLERRVVDYRNKLRQQELREQQSIFVGEFTEEQANAEQKNQIELDHLVHQPGGLVEKDNITIFSGTNSIPAQHDGPTDEFAGSPSFAGTLGSTTTVQSTQDLSDHRELSFVNKSSAPTLQSEVLASNSTIKDGADMDVAISLNAPDEGKETSKSREARRKNESEVYSLNTLQTLEQRLAKLHEELREIKHAALTPSSSDPVGQGSDSDAVISSTEIAASASLLSMDTLPKVDLDASAQESSLDILDDKSIKPSNVPLLIAPPTLKADLHEHQVSSWFISVSYLLHIIPDLNLFIFSLRYPDSE